MGWEKSMLDTVRAMASSVMCQLGGVYKELEQRIRQHPGQPMIGGVCRALEERIRQHPGQLILLVNATPLPDQENEKNPILRAPHTSLCLGVLKNRNPKLAWDDDGQCSLPTTRYVRSEKFRSDCVVLSAGAMSAKSFGRNTTLVLPGPSSMDVSDSFVGDTEVKAWFESYRGYVPYLYPALLEALSYTHS